MTTTVLNPSIDCTVSTARRGILARIAGMLAVNHQRKSLKNLDAHMLHDIGITRKDAQIEAQKPLWDVPIHWSK